MSSASTFTYDGTNLAIGSNTALHAGNYNSYSPTLTGTGASGTWGISISGSAATLTTGRTIALTGDVTYTSGSFNGSANVTGTATLANSGVTAGTYTKVTVDAKGRVTTGASLASGDLPTYTGTITSSQVTTALGFTPYNSTNPNGYITSSALSNYLPLTGGTINASGEQTITINRPSGWNYFGFTLAGVRRAYFGLDSLGNPVWGSDSGPLNISGTLNNNSNQVLNAANYTSYSPSLTGTGASGSWGISVTGNAATAGGLSVHSARNNEANKLVRTDGNGYLQTGYINSSNGDEGNNANPSKVWGTNGSDSYLRTYLTSALSVNYANSAGSVAWTNVSGRPTALSSFTNDSGYITGSGRAFPKTGSGASINFNWSGQNGQPTWLWGANAESDSFVYNPSNFSVNYANSAGSVSGGLTTSNYSSYALPLSGGSLSGSLSVTGNISATGNITAYSSDLRLKTNIVQITGAISKVKKLTGFVFNWNDLAKSLANYDTEELQVGVGAQDVLEVQPEAVKPAPFDFNLHTNTSKSKNNYLTVQYEKLVPLLIEAIKEQQAQIDNLKTILESKLGGN